MTELWDPLAPGFTTDPYTPYARLRREDPVHEVEIATLRCFIVTRYDDVVAVLRDPAYSATRFPERMIADAMTGPDQRFCGARARRLGHDADQGSARPHQTPRPRLQGLHAARRRGPAAAGRSDRGSVAFGASTTKPSGVPISNPSMAQRNTPQARGRPRDQHVENGRSERLQGEAEVAPQPDRLSEKGVRGSEPRRCPLPWASTRPHGSQRTWRGRWASELQRQASAPARERIRATGPCTSTSARTIAAHARALYGAFTGQRGL